MKLVKTGRFAFGGLRVKTVNSLDGLSEKEIDNLVKSGWVVDGEAPAKQEEPAVEEDKTDEIQALVDAGDKNALVAFAAEKGVELGKRGKIETLAEKLREELSA